uniref:ribosomal protein S11 n=1 Tax=Thonningia sanguinea TaxID=1618145 RepID=UPI0026E168C7|nr:ribosomal protein S11 [Thonningia sanguinea]WJE89142.1 ribosomal protein S11 [Thonningia sanguinea]
MENIKKDNKKLQITLIGVVYINTNFNNIIITATDFYNRVLFWSSGGSCGFTNSKKKTPFAIQIVTKKILKKLIRKNIKKIKVFLKGSGYFRDVALRVLYESNIDLCVVQDVTPISHNGCRLPKKKRI